MTARNGDTVRVHYTGWLDDSTIFDSSVGHSPIQFTLGHGEVIPGFEAAVAGMEVGEHRSVQVPQEQAYGPHLDELVATIKAEQLPGEVNPQIGEQLQVANRMGESFVMTVINRTESTVTLDANHPLAGHDLKFDIDLIDIV